MEKNEIKIGSFVKVKSEVGFVIGIKEDKYTIRIEGSSDSGEFRDVIASIKDVEKADDADIIIDRKEKMLKNKKIKNMREEISLVNRVLNPETYVDMVIDGIINNPNSSNPDIMRSIIRGAIIKAMAVWSYQGHIISIEGERDKAVAKCIHCKKEFPLKEIPSTTLCRK